MRRFETLAATRWRCRRADHHRLRGRFIALVIAELLGLFENPYSGLVVFIALPAVFLFGLLLIPLGMWLEQRKLERHPEAAAGWPVIDLGKPVVRRRVLLFTALTAVNVIIILLAGYGSLHWMDSPQFCGQACHTPMEPQFTAWRDGPHSRIACAHCHIGSGAQGFVQAKLAGTRQLAHVITNSVPKPVRRARTWRRARRPNLSRLSPAPRVAKAIASV